MTLELIDVDAIRPLGSKILARRYTKPAEVRGIIIPESVRADDTLSLWEFVRAGPRAEEVYGMKLRTDDIIQTRPWRGVAIADNSDYFIIDAHEIINVVRWQEEEEA